MVDGGWWMVAALVAFLSFDFEVQLDMKKAGTWMNGGRQFGDRKIRCR